MTTTQFGRNLLQITKFRVINCYLVREEDGLTLIDAGMPGMESMILDAAQTWAGLPITRILFTHVHSDHIGALDGLRKLLPDAEVLMSAQSARFLAGDMSLEPGQASTKLKGGFPKVATRPTATLADGDHVGSLRVVATPGHTPAHLAFYDERDGSLIAGDALQTQGGLAVAGVMRWRFPLPAFATWHKPTAAASAEKLLALNPTRLAVGHGPVLENPVAAMRQAVAVAKQQS